MGESGHRAAIASALRGTLRTMRLLGPVVLAMVLAVAAVLLTALVVALVRIIRALIKTPAQQR